ncbi:Multidrug-efflux transporter [Hartmannibacter diazotrophicus]|uniref:Multidrug-efflux transporter n=2 Tax=Hartmannibacter diazotrophicus TaxID=1482074 RepID=A0A2C9D640_9HYPH|nr:Multidrug-efflux transporter [Hartmannibacter diazotrophicus]
MPIGQHVSETLRLAGPITMGHFSNLAVTTATLLMFGWTSADTLAAGGLAMRIGVSTNILAAILVISGLMMSEVQGAGQGHLVSRWYTNGLVLSAVLSALSFAWMTVAPSVLAALGQEPAIVADAEAILNIMRWAEPANMIRLGLMRTALPALGLASILFALTPLSLIAYIGLGLALAGMPQIGWHGIPMAFVVISWAVALVMLAIVHLGPRRGLVRFDIGGVMEMLRLVWRGLPIGTLQAIDGVYYLALTLLIGRFGAATLAAHQLVLNFGTIAWALASAFGDAGALRISYSRGASALGDIWRAGFVAAALGILSMTIAAIVVAANPTVFIGFFIDAANPANYDAVAVALALTPWTAGFIFADGFYGVGMGVLRGIDDNRFAMLATVTLYGFVGLPLAYGFAFLMGFGGEGIWMGIVCGVLLVGNALVGRFWWQSRRATGVPVRAVSVPRGDPA